MSNEAPPSAQTAWESFCDRLKQLGGPVLGGPIAVDPRSRAEGARWLARLAVCAVRAELSGGDPDAPVFYRYEEPDTQWGAPNPDNVYLRTAIHPAGRYRVWCDARNLRQAIFSLHEGDMQLEEYGVYSERSLDQLHVDEAGRLELVLCAEEQPGNWLPMHPRARLFQIRIYQGDWERDATPPFHIERLDRDAPPAGLDEAAVCDALDRAARWIEASAGYWPRYASGALERLPPNVATPPRSAPGGADNILYGSCAYTLLSDEALLLETTPPDADYFSFALHTVPWFESGDFARRFTSLNGAQLTPDADGRLRVVVAASDPGTPNWLDTEGRPRGLLTYRYVWARGASTPQARLLPLSELRAALPPDHPRVSPDARRAALRRRREAATRRYL